MDNIIERVVAGDVRVVARLIRNIDDGTRGIRSILKELYPYTGKAYVVGITGSPGVGKSTLVDQLTKHLRAENKTVGVLAVDPTSPFSGGAVLGDRIRMQQHFLDPGVFIRSMATRGQFGGLTHSTRSAIDVLDAMGKDVILVETVGVGQDEVDIVKSAHTTVIVVMPGMGDDIQMLKAGILEVGDVFVINKADREGTDRTENQLRMMIEMDQRKCEEGAWLPPIIKTQASFDIGVKNLLEEINRHRSHLAAGVGGLQMRRHPEKVSDELADMVKSRLIDIVSRRIIRSGDFDGAVTSIVAGEKDPYTVCDDLILPLLES